MPQASSLHRDIPPELEDELFSRNRFFFQEGFQNIRDALVIVVGLGGVGSHAAHMLVSVCQVLGVSREETLLQIKLLVQRSWVTESRCRT